MNALAVDDTVDMSRYDLPQGVDLLDLNDPEQVIEWILNHAKVLE